MIIDLRRFRHTADGTIGTLHIDESFAAFTMEDAIRGEKIRAKTAIPEGSYDIKLREEGGMIKKYQVKFGEAAHPGMLWLQDVPDFKWVYLHIGNTPRDTEGCILVGSTYDYRQPDVIQASTAAYRRIYDLIMPVLEYETVTINVKQMSDL